MSDIPAIDPEVFRRSRLEAERFAEARAEELRRRGTWLMALRVALSVGLLVVSFFPIIEEKRTSEQQAVWVSVGGIGQGPAGTLVGIWTLVTLLLVVAALVTPARTPRCARRCPLAKTLASGCARHDVIEEHSGSLTLGSTEGSTTLCGV
jgi:hypothetical protein